MSGKSRRRSPISDSKIKGGAIGRLVGGQSRRCPSFRAVPGRRRRACQRPKSASCLAIVGTAPLWGRGFMWRGPDLDRKEDRSGAGSVAHGASADPSCSSRTSSPPKSSPASAPDQSATVRFGERAPRSAAAVSLPGAPDERCSASAAGASWSRPGSFATAHARRRSLRISPISAVRA
jgi:hypothetical protein